MSDITTDEDEQKKSDGTSWLQIFKAILTGLVTILTALGVSGCSFL